MKKTYKPQLRLQAETVRPLLHKELAASAGGRAYNTNLTYFSMCTYTPTTACWA